METIEIKGRNIFNIQNTELPAKDYSEKSKLAGQTYSTFSYEGKGFIANDNNPFKELLKAGKIYAAKLSVNEEGQLSLVGYTTTEQEETMSKFEARLKRLEVVANYVPSAETMTDEKLAALLA